MADPAGILGPLAARLKKTAIVEIVVGVCCLVAPLLAGLVLTLLIGIALVVDGALLVRDAWAEREGTAGKGWKLLEGVLIGALGLYFVFAPLAGLEVITIVLAIAIVVAGALRIAVALRLRPLNGWWVLLVAGVLGVVAGVLLFAGLPLSGVWAVGVFLGISILSAGFARLALATTLARAAGRGSAA